LFGRQGQDCTAICAASGLLCSDAFDKHVFTLLDGASITLIMDTLSDGLLQCGSTAACALSALCPNMQYSGLSFMQPICYVDAEEPLNVGFQCSVVDSSQFLSDRLCPCVLDPSIAAEFADTCVACPLDATAGAMPPACIFTPPPPEPDVAVLTVFSASGFAGARIASCPVNATSPADATSVEECVCAPGFSRVASTERTQDFVCIGAWQHAMVSELLTCEHANGRVLPFENYDTSDPTEQMPCAQVTLADCQTAVATNVFNFSVHVQFDGNAVCFGV